MTQWGRQMPQLHPLQAGLWTQTTGGIRPPCHLELANGEFSHGRDLSARWATFVARSVLMLCFSAVMEFLPPWIRCRWSLKAFSWELNLPRADGYQLFIFVAKRSFARDSVCYSVHHLSSVISMQCMVGCSRICMILGIIESYGKIDHCAES